MKPLRLKMYGIGPYTTLVDIDFTRLNEKGLFLITGATGAGKTSIFDGITYALYGETNFGDKEKTNGIICDYLDNKEHKNVYVEFIFEVDNIEYTVKRTPAYYRYKKNGERNLTKTGEKIEIDTNSKKVIPDKKEDRDRYIREEILKVDVSQFKKLIMLPQGDFSEFIRSNSNSKTKTLEKIFDTDIYKSITQKLNDKVEKLKNNQKEAKNNIFAELKTLNIDDQRWNELLKEKLLAFEELTQIIQTKKTLLEKEQKEAEEKIQKLDLQKIINAIAKGTTDNKGVTDLKEAKEKLDILKKRSLDIKQIEEKLKVFKKAEKIKIEYINKEDATKDYDEKNKNYRIYKQKYKDFIEENSSKIGKLHIYKEDLKDLENKLNTLNLLKDDVDRYKKISQEININEKKLKEIEDLLKTQITAEQKELLTEKKLEEKKEKIEGDIQSRSVLELEKNRCENKKLTLKDTINKYQKIQNKEKEKIDKKNELEKLTLKKQSELKKYNKQSDLWFQSEAYNLVEQLEEGKPCPVCGSVDHPVKAEKPENVPTEEELNEYKKNYNDVKDKENKLIGKIETMKENIVISKKELKEKLQQEKLDDNYEKILKLEKENKDRLKDIEKQLKGLFIEKDLIDIRKKKDINKIILKDIKTEKERLEKTKFSLESDLANKKETIDSLKTKLDIKKIDITTFEEDYKKLEKEKNNKDLEVKNIEKLKKEKEEKETTLKEKKDVVKEFEKKSNIAKETFEKKLAEEEFYEESEYLKAKKINGNQLEGDIKSHKDELLVVGTVIDTKKEYEGVELVDLKILKAEKEVLEKEKNELNNLVAQKKNEIKLLDKQKKELKATKKEIKQEEKTFNLYKKLLDISKGEYGDKKNKVTFQSYVLGVYFEEVLDRANERFAKMTNHQYKMILHRGDPTGNGKAGLDINVFDTHTGRERSIKTLSGGETFKASMALALGLSDVVQAQNGGIQLDSVFIDEGFGTLDEESLSMAMDTLIELKSSGRTVGIISHVNELKQTISSQIRIEKTSRGSKAEVIF